MQFTTVLAALLATAVSASPIDVASKRNVACSVAGPSVLGLTVSKGAPQTVSFAVTAPAVGPCQLEAVFPAAYYIASTGNPQLNVIDVNGPVPGSIVGTVTLQSDPNQPTRRFINSFGCRTDAPMAYRFEIAGDAGSVSYAPQPGVGLRMTYNC